MDNTPAQVVAAPKAGDMAIILRRVAEGNDPMEGARILEKASKSSLVSKTQRTTISGLPAARTPGLGLGVTVDLIWIAHGGLIYRSAVSRRRQGLKPCGHSLITCRKASVLFLRTNAIPFAKNVFA